MSENKDITFEHLIELYKQLDAVGRGKFNEEITKIFIEEVMNEINKEMINSLASGEKT